MVILDTDVLSAAMARDEVVIAWLNRQSRTTVWTTAVTVFEIRSGLMAMPSGRRRSERELAFGNIIERDIDGRILPFDNPAAEEAAILVALRRRAGKPREVRDTMIAGIALARRATLATRNIRHFNDLSVLVVDPWNA